MARITFLAVVLATVSTVHADTWHYRKLRVGRAISTYTLDSYTLERPKGGEPVLTIEHAEADEETGPTGPFKTVSTEVKRGADIGLTCKPTTVRVAPANALRVKTPHDTSECGDRGVWSTKRMVKVKALACSSEDSTMTFSEKGLEEAGLSEECYIQGSGLRLIPPDGRVMPLGKP